MFIQTKPQQNTAVCTINPGTINPGTINPGNTHYWKHCNIMLYHLSLKRLNMHYNRWCQMKHFYLQISTTLFERFNTFELIQNILRAKQCVQ